MLKIRGMSTLEDFLAGMNRFGQVHTAIRCESIERLNLAHLNAFRMCNDGFRPE